jgi:hypothetical protein
MSFSPLFTFGLFIIARKNKSHKSITCSIPCISSACKSFILSDTARLLDQLLKSTVDRGADIGDILPEVDGSDGALANTLRGELKFLHFVLA